MKANEVMLDSDLILRPTSSVADAKRRVARSALDVIPVVDDSGRYHGAVQKSSLLDYRGSDEDSVTNVCCEDALICDRAFALEDLNHDAESPIPHRTIMVVDHDGTYQGIIPQVHWAVDEAKTQSGHPRQVLEVRTFAMHLTYRCTECGELVKRNHGVPSECPACGAGPSDFAMYTED
ncbi:DUF7130 family rubredoxin-like protein [Alicyclobacillus ferrooxydans]|uniref:CBS domain-containing protein n=1 Tax=Alicyclobacillus ferrooxydans TaxID=471514 RepID=A0A0P9D8A0_9BACL|nr:CBS domain-containing protein [Alicyclobacillus ferrooxydans]KPV45524.1 hypothetical protein AN477_00790 [Alicyclobacillus ferrooxydans]